jgi:hypothetical protein
VRRKWLLALAGVVLAAAVLVPASGEPRASRQKLARGRLIDRAHFDRIEVGMRYEEVAALLGGPPEDFRTGNTLYFGPPPSTLNSIEGRGWRLERWRGDVGQILVTFDRRDAVEPRYFEEGHMFSPAAGASATDAEGRRPCPALPAVPAGSG